jgi:hypothetical protein
MGYLTEICNTYNIPTIIFSSSIHESFVHHFNGVFFSIILLSNMMDGEIASSMVIYSSFVAEWRSRRSMVYKDVNFMG